MNRSKYHEKIQNCSFTCKNLDRFYKSLPKNLTIARIEVQLATKITLFQLLCRKRYLARIKEFQKRKIREKIETSEKRLESIKKLRHRLRSLFCNTKWTALNLKNYFSQQGLKCLQNITISNAVILSTVFTSPRIQLSKKTPWETIIWVWDQMMNKISHLWFLQRSSRKFQALFFLFRVIRVIVKFIKI